MAVILQRELRKFVAPEFIAGDNSRVFAGRYAGNFHSKKILLTTSPQIIDMKWMAGITDSLSDAGIDYELFMDITENPRDTDVMRGSEVYSAEECTGIIAVGGGSVMDCSKGIGIVSANKGHISDYVGVDLVKNPMPPLICLPTTGGSSADVSQYAVISCRERKCKNLIISKSLVPDVSLLDTVVLTTQPDEITVYSGIDAFTHAVEAYVSNGSSHFSDLMALEAIRQTGNAFPYDPSMAYDLDFRFKTLLSSLYAGISFSNAGLGIIHSMSHAIGGMYDLAHGLSSSLVMGAVIRFNYDAAADKYRNVAKALSIKTSGKNDEEVKELLLEKISQMMGTFCKDTKLSSFGASEDDLPFLISNTMSDPCVVTNPKMPGKSDIEDLFRQVL
ncbi:MAG: iron-containing alcohol dehydrogenase [Methanomicrobiaceae archaeon]|nr:iron-containing alcohol dehydrogenase [Methanomicrobiaceae archaeon]